MAVNLSFPLSPYKNVALVFYHMNFFLFSFHYLSFLDLLRLKSSSFHFWYSFFRVQDYCQDTMLPNDLTATSRRKAQPGAPGRVLTPRIFSFMPFWPYQHSPEKTSKMSHHSTKPSAPPAPQHTRPSTTLAVSRSRTLLSPTCLYWIRVYQVAIVRWRALPLKAVCMLQYS